MTDSQRLWQVLRWLLATFMLAGLIMLLAAHVRAQDTDLSGPFANIETVLALTALIAAWLTKLVTALGKDWLKTQGPATVALSGVIAALIGGIGGWFSLGAFAGEGGLTGAVAAIGTALFAFIGSNASAKSDRQALAGAVQRAQATTPVALLATDPQSITDYLLDLVRQRFGSQVPVYVWSMIDALAREFAGKVLTEDVRAVIQRRFLDLLAKAGAGGRDV